MKIFTAVEETLRRAYACNQGALPRDSDRGSDDCAAIIRVTKSCGERPPFWGFGI